MTRTLPISTEIKENSNFSDGFETKIVTNGGFLDAMEQGMEKKLPSILSNETVRQEARLEIQKLFADMKKREFIRGATKWTAHEQKSFFKKVQDEIGSAGPLASGNIREKIQTLIEDEIWREINDGEEKYSLVDGGGNTIIPNIGEYQNFLDTSFLLAKETTIIPLDLRLTISKTETIQNAKKKLERYHGKYNALVLVDEKNHPLGVIQANHIKQYENTSHTTLEGIPVLSDAFAHYATTNDELKKSMQKYGINILPIIDSKTGILIGILTNTSLVKKEVQYYSTTSLTRLKIKVEDASLVSK